MTADTITLPRAVIEQAIESMQGYARETGDTQPCDAEQALRAALAQQAKPSLPEYFSQMKTEFTKELRTFSIIFSCEPMIRSIDECEYAGELLQRAANIIDTMNADRETEILHAELNPKKPNCTECAKWDKEQADDKEWHGSVARGREIVSRMAAAPKGGV